MNRKQGKTGINVKYDNRRLSEAGIKKLIENYEFYSNGFHKLENAKVYVYNVRVKKRKILADVKVLFGGKRETKFLKNKVYSIDELWS